MSPDSELVLQGELREGEQFAYWRELAYDDTGRATSGRMAVFLKEDVSGLEAQLGEKSTHHRMTHPCLFQELIL